MAAIAQRGADVSNGLSSASSRLHSTLPGEPIAFGSARLSRQSTPTTPLGARRNVRVDTVREMLWFGPPVVRNEEHEAGPDSEIPSQVQLLFGCGGALQFAATRFSTVVRLGRAA